MMSVSTALRGLDRWLDGMRVDWPTPGYGGPVVHWWRHQLVYRGTGLDWRYEGIIAGYLALWRASGNFTFREKAARAGDDLLAGQTVAGHFRNSSFELNPGDGGTPHEAAVDIALLQLAKAFATVDPVRSGRYRDAAERNLDAYFFGKLWHPQSSTLRDSTTENSFVPNKAATFLEAVLLLAEINGDWRLVEQYALPTAARIVEMQVPETDNELDGGFAQNRFGTEVVHAYFPLYVARCLPPLFALAELVNNDCLLKSALRGTRFLERIRNVAGSFPQVLYLRGRRSEYPRWIAGSGEMLRAMMLADQYGAEAKLEPTIDWILSGTKSDGHIATAEGFSQMLPPITRGDEELDEIGVVGWCDKAFRAFAELAAIETSDSFHGARHDVPGESAAPR
jgi:hypothetical protein